MADDTPIEENSTTQAHSAGTSIHEPLHSRPANISHRMDESRRPYIPARRIYHQNELLRIGAVVNNQAVRRIHSARDNLSKIQSDDISTLRRTASAYNGVARDRSVTRADSSTARSTGANSVPIRQPKNPEGDFDWQKAKGFARFIREHASPRHHRVTAGGRIVPAIPNTPPPTFHEAFLEAFLHNEARDQAASSDRNTSASSSRRATSVSQYGQPITSNYPYPPYNGLHPSLKVPPGFRVIEASTSGTIAIAMRGTTIYRCELMVNGETSIKVAAQGSMLSTNQSSLGGEPVRQSESGTVIYNYPNEPAQPVYNHYGPSTDVPQHYHYYQSPDHHGTNAQSSWQEVEQQLQQSFNAQVYNTSHTYFGHQPYTTTHAIPNTPGIHTGSYQQQMAALDEAIQGWTTMLMDAERVLCFPKVLGQAGVESTQMKKQVMLVKIDELTRKRDQLVAHMNTHTPGTSTRAESESAYHPSSRRESIYTHYSGDAVPETKVLSPLARPFMPKTSWIDATDLNTDGAAPETSDHAQKDPVPGLDGAADESDIDGGPITRQGPRIPKPSATPNAKATSDKRAISDTFAKSINWSRIPGETDAEYNARCAEQRQRATSARFALAKDVMQAVIQNGSKGQAPTLQGLRVTSMGIQPTLHGSIGTQYITRAQDDKTVA